MPPASSVKSNGIEIIRRQVRLLMILDAAYEAGLCPIAISKLHALAYLANVLAPIWNMPALDGKILKRRGGPYYPELQQDLDRLVGIGVVSILKPSHKKDLDGRWKLEGSYQLNRAFSDRILSLLYSYQEERNLLFFIRELAFAASALSESEFQPAVAEDATYSDPTVSFDNVVDFDELKHLNFSSDVARYFERVSPREAPISAAEKLHLYVRHLNKRANVG